MSEVRLKAEQRTEFGKGAARRIRRANLVRPSYTATARSPPREPPRPRLMMALKTSNVLLELDLDGGGRELTLPKHVQRDPIKGYLEHVDLVVVRRGREGHGRRPAAHRRRDRARGLLSTELNTLSVEAEATSIPAQLEIDVEGMAIGSSVRAGEVRAAGGHDTGDRPRDVGPTRDGGTDGRADRGGAGRGRGRRRHRARRRRRSSRRRAPPPAAPTSSRGNRWRRFSSDCAAILLKCPIVALSMCGSWSAWATRAEYSANRHNVGRMVVDLLAERLGTRFKAHKGRADVVEGRIGSTRVVLARPRTYMNDSGTTVAALSDYYKVPPDRLVTIHDELDLPYGDLRLKLGGGDNGHNGLKSCVAPWVRASSTGYGSVSAARLVGWIRRHSSSRTSVRRSARNCRSMSTAPRTRWSPWSPRGWRGLRTSSTADRTADSQRGEQRDSIRSIRSIALNPRRRSAPCRRHHLRPRRGRSRFPRAGTGARKFGERSGLERGHHPDRTIESLVARGIAAGNAA